MIFGPRKPKVKRSPEWPRLRRQWLAINPACAACGERKKVEVHHVEPVSWNPARELDSTNLISLCEQGSHNDHFLLGHLLDWHSKNDSVRVDVANLLREIRTRPYPK